MSCPDASEGYPGAFLISTGSLLVKVSALPQLVEALQLPMADPHSSAFRSGALEIVINPENG